GACRSSRASSYPCSFLLGRSIRPQHRTKIIGPRARPRTFGHCARPLSNRAAQITHAARTRAKRGATRERPGKREARPGREPSTTPAKEAAEPPYRARGGGAVALVRRGLAEADHRLSEAVRQQREARAA